MTARLVFGRQARAEYETAADWYEKECAGLGTAFQNAVQSAIDQIAAHPAQFPKIHGDIRQAVIRRFPYCIYFRERGAAIDVLAVFHSARNPALWRWRN